MVYKNIFLIQESSPNRCWNDRRGSRDVLHHYLTPHISITALVVVVETVVQGQVVVPSVVVGVFSSLTLSWFLEDDEDDENSQAKEADEYRGDVLQREAVRSDATAKLEMESFTFVCVQELMDGRMDVWISGWMDGCMDKWMGVRMDGWMCGCDGLTIMATLPGCSRWWRRWIQEWVWWWRVWSGYCIVSEIDF